MALSQISFFTLPQKTFQKLSQSHLKKEDHLFDDSVYWASERAPCDFFAKIGSFLPINTSWSKQITLYGQQDSNCFEVLCEDQIILSVSFRIDFTSDYEDILRNLIEFFITNDLLILDQDLTTIPLNFESVRSVIETSPKVETYRWLSKNRQE
jgi:hypothetical protein